MSLVSIEERVQLLKNVLDDPFDWVSEELLRLADEHERTLNKADAEPVEPLKTQRLNNP